MRSHYGRKNRDIYVSVYSVSIKNLLYAHWRGKKYDNGALAKHFGYIVCGANTGFWSRNPSAQIAWLLLRLFYAVARAKKIIMRHRNYLRI